MVPQPGDSSFDIFDRLRKKHGNLVGLCIGTQPTILVSGLENIKKICASEEFLYRPHLPVTQHAKFGSDKKLGKEKHLIKIYYLFKDYFYDQRNVIF